MTALGAVLSTLGRMILEAGLLRRRRLPAACDSALSEGRVAVIVDIDEAAFTRTGSIEEVLARRGAEVL
jgi:hypothetical protein